MHSTFGNKYVCECTFSTLKQVKGKNRNRMADETPDHSLRLASTNILVLLKERWCQRSLIHRNRTDRDL